MKIYAAPGISGCNKSFFNFLLYKVVINRLDNYGDKIFHDYQYCFIRNRNPCSATRIIEIVKKNIVRKGIEIIR